MGSRLMRLLPLVVLSAASAMLAGCGGDRVPASEGLEAQLRDANARANDGTSVRREHSLRRIEDRTPGA